MDRFPEIKRVVDAMVLLSLFFLLLVASTTLFWPRTAPTSPCPTMAGTLPVYTAYIQWSETTGVLGGKGMQTGTSSELQFWTDYSQTEGDSRLSLYAWTTDPLVEYRIVEDFSSSDQFDHLVLKGNVTSDGSVYNIYEATVVNETSILLGTNATFSQYWSVRQTPRNSDYLSIANHVNE
ncbi:concanavalin A-like lectin/glucanase domain-containing protein [Mycena galericulata]|nr:concanavalin A-like lectin/glucanase domain-containing protein [Mycena galericulata]